MSEQKNEITNIQNPKNSSTEILSLWDVRLPAGSNTAVGTNVSCGSLSPVSHMDGA